MSRSSLHFESSSGFSKSNVGNPPVRSIGSPDPEGFSDDSGVDLRPQRRCLDNIATVGTLGESRKNKRKSSEPKKRKDVLQMKRFQWDSEDEDEDEEDGEGGMEGDRDSDDVFEDVGERPSSGDSGFQSGTAENHIPLTGREIRCHEQESRVPEAKEELAGHRKIVKSEPVLYEHRTVGKNSEHDKEERQRRRRQPRSKQTRVLSQDESRILPPVLRQSVIKKHDSVSLPSTSAMSQSCVLPSTTTSSSLSRLQPTLITSSQSDDCYPLDLGVGPSTTTAGDSSRGDGPRATGRPRNYKSMSRQRRIEANARERSRVHTISAAFESLRRAVPAYAHNQKLSKLAILRIASAYIVALGCLNEQGCDKQHSGPSLADCVDQCTRTIQAEGRTRRRTKVGFPE